MLNNKYYQFHLKHQGFAIKIKLNDIFIEEDPDGLFKDRSFINNQFVIDGENQVVIEISLAGKPPKIPDDINLTFSVYEMTESMLQNKESPVPILEIIFPGNDVPQFPVTLKGVFQTSNDFEKWIWQDGEVINTITEEHLYECQRLIEYLYSLIADKDYVGIHSLLSIKTEEMAKAYYIPLQEREKDQEIFFKDIFNDIKFDMEPLTKNLFDIVPMANNRIFLLQQKNGDPIIESKELSEGYCFTLPVYVSRIGGVFKIIR